MRSRLQMGCLLAVLCLIGTACSGPHRKGLDEPPATRPPAARAPRAAPRASTDAQAEARVAADLKKMGADVSRDDSLPGRPPMRVSFWNTRVTDADLPRLAPLRHLSLLDLRGTPVTDAGLRNLPALPGLRELDLSETKVTDAGLKELGKFPELDSLHFDKTQVTDGGLKELPRLKRLRWVTLWQCPGVTETGAKELERALPQGHVAFQPAPAPRRPRLRGISR
jgi:hypothetical protein